MSMTLCLTLCGIIIFVVVEFLIDVLEFLAILRTTRRRKDLTNIMMVNLVLELNFMA